MPPSLPLADAIGQIICPTLFHGLAKGAAYDPVRAAEQLDQYGWGGYIVFHDDRDKLRARLAALHGRARTPLLVAADMEHGAGQQLRNCSVFPPAMAFGATDDPQLAYDLGAITAQEAREVGVNWILAPVADVTNNPANPIINIRSFGGDPARVAAMVAAFVRGCQDHGVLACAKHFPGHGDTATDSHTRLGSVTASRERLAAVEFPPFQAAIGAGVASIMTAHLAVPALDEPDLPATLSRRVMTGLLREEWDFDGLVVTDALGMGGITAGLDPLVAAVRALEAGCDMLLMPPDPVATHAAIARAVETGRLAAARVYEAANRVLAAKARLAVHRQDPPARVDRNALAARVAAQALTLARGEPGHQVPDYPLTIGVDDGAEPAVLETWQRTLPAMYLPLSTIVSAATTQAEWAELAARAAAAPAVLIGVFSPIRIHKDRSLLPASVLAPLQAICARTPTTVVSFSSPFLVAQFPAAAAWVLTYGARPRQIEAALDALHGHGRYPGRLPITLPDWLDAAPGGDEPPPDRGPSFA